MSAVSAPPRRPTDPPSTASSRGRVRFGALLRSEWTKFRTVRGWLIGLVLAVLLTVLFTYLVANGQHTGSCTGSASTCRSGHPFVPTGPDGEAVADSYYFLSQPLTGRATITARLASLTGLTSTAPLNVAPSLAATRPGLAAWAKAGILLTPSTTQGSAYAAVMATGSHGARFQYDYTHDRPGPPPSGTDSSPRWLRLTRSRNLITGYDSTDGTTWHQIGTAQLTGLPATVQIGLFVTSPIDFHTPDNGAATRAAAAFDQITVNAATPANTWRGHSIGARATNFYPTLGPGSSHRVGTTEVISGSGDIAPAVPLSGGNTASDTLSFGLIVALIVLIVIAILFITVEYRRGLIRATFTATPDRCSVLAAKAVVIGVIAFLTGAVAAAVAVPVGEHLLTTNGNYIFPASALTLARIIAGTGALLSVTAVAVLALATILRRSAGAVTAGIVVFVLPNLIGPGVLGPGASGSAATWLYRLTPAAGFSILGALPRSALVDYPYTLGNGYYPLPPWAGLAVLCGYAAAALTLAALLLRRRDA